jgi:hypothetical protein
LALDCRCMNAWAGAIIAALRRVSSTDMASKRVVYTRFGVRVTVVGPSVAIAVQALE